MNARRILTATALTASLAGMAHADTVIIFDDFSGTGVELNGATPDIGPGNWDAGTGIFLDDGSILGGDSSANGNPAENEGSAFLAFTPEAGTLYELEATITNPGASWVAVGFADTNNTKKGVNGRLSNSNTEVGGFAWMLTLDGKQSAFSGKGTGLKYGVEGTADNTVPVTLKILLDTTDTVWTAEYFVDGTTLGPAADLPSLATSQISYVAISRDNNTNTPVATISSFSLTQVPEPSSLALMGLGGLAMMRRRRA